MSRAEQDRNFRALVGRDAAATHSRTQFAPDLAAHEQSEAAFSWSRRKIRFAAVALLGFAVPAVAGFAVAGSFGKWVCLAWLTGVAALMGLLCRRAASEEIVLTINERGIFDRRLMPRQIDWQEIEAVCHVNMNGGHVIDLRLRWPKTTLRGTPWRVRIGAFCQTGFDVTAVTISMLLLGGRASDVVDAIARYRPDLLSAANRQVIAASRVITRKLNIVLCAGADLTPARLSRYLSATVRHRAGAARVASRSSGDREPGDRLAIDLDAEARTFGDGNDAGLVLERRLEHGLAERVLRAVELEHRLERRMPRRGMRQHGQQLQGGGQADAAAPHVRHVAHAERRRHVGNLLALGQTAGGASVGLQDVDGAPRQHLAEAPARELALPPATGIGWPRRTSR